MARKSVKITKSTSEKDTKLSRISAFFFRNWRLSFLLWVAILASGTAVYTSIIKREGFPPIQFPLSLVSGAYVGQSADAVDKDITQPISEALNDVAQITDVDASANQGFFSVAVGFDDTMTSTTGTQLVQNTIAEKVNLPEGALISYAAIDPGSFLLEYDMLVQVYSTMPVDDQTIDLASIFVAEQLESVEGVDSAVANANLSEVPGSNGTVIKTNFSRINPIDDSEGQAFLNSVVVGVNKTAESDVLQLSDDVNEKLASLDLSQFGDSFNAAISADFARDITQQIDFLESNIFTGLLAVAFVSFLLITWRASIITALFMVTVIVSTILVLYLIGYTLNVITLFALILSLGLFVDDATIVVEAIDAQKRNKKLKRLEVAKHAVRKVGMASLSGTLTTVLVFAILAAPTGILGEFIRLIPITVITALILSFILSMTLIPFLSRFIILGQRGQDSVTRNNPILKLEEYLSEFVEKTVLGVRTAKGKIIGGLSVLASIVLVMIGMYIFGFKVDQNTFPPPKDADQLGVSIAFAPGTSITEAEDISGRVEQALISQVGEHVVSAYYGAEQLPDTRQAVIVVELVPFTDRDVPAPELRDQLRELFARDALGAASVSVSTVDNGPPSSSFPFGIRVYSDDAAVLADATQKIATQFVGTELENFNGEKIAIQKSQIDGVEGQILRDKGRRYAITRFAYDSENPTIVSVLTEQEFKDAYGLGAESPANNEYETEATLSVMEELGVDAESIGFDAGQEGDFQESFNTLALAVPLALGLMYVLLAVQFRSLIQPFLILLAIPFTLFGVGIGMYLTNNAASFFVLTGFIGLIGISVNNTIMLTDYANQERRAGKSKVEAIAAASRKRLRPLIATTLTTIVALLPLALSDPFWEALAFTIIFGLASSTFLVLLSFPYYYLFAEWVRGKTGRIFGRA